MSANVDFQRSRVLKDSAKMPATYLSPFLTLSSQLNYKSGLKDTLATKESVFVQPYDDYEINETILEVADESARYIDKSMDVNE